MLTLLADQHIYRLPELLPTGINLITYDPQKGWPSHKLESADALFVRSVTPVNKATLTHASKRLAFVGTASAGTDHIDAEYLKNRNIHFASSAGCNARSVAEYAAVVILLWAEQNNLQYHELTTGIVGAGHVGTQVDKLLNRLGIHTILYDPPRELRDERFKSSSLESVLSSDILTLHVPLKTGGRWSTFHWLDHDKLVNRSFQLVINAARGGVIDEKELLMSYRKGTVRDFILDVWENEPVFSDDSVENAFIATPHIAGYSKQAKYRATKMIVDQLSTHFGIDRLPHALSAHDQISSGVNEAQINNIGDLLRRLHPATRYDEKLRMLIGLDKTDKMKRFSELRTGVPFRNEFSCLSVPEQIFNRYPVLQKLGFQCDKGL